MTEIISTIDGENHVSIPAEIRRLLGVRAGGQIVFVIADDGAIAVRASDEPAEATVSEEPDWHTSPEGRPYPEYTLEETIGSLPMLPNMSMDFDAEIEDAIHEALDLKLERLAKQRQ